MVKLESTNDKILDIEIKKNLQRTMFGRHRRDRTSYGEGLPPKPDMTA